MKRSNYTFIGKIALLLALIIIPAFFLGTHMSSADGFCVRGRERCEKYFPDAFYPRKEPASGYNNENKANNASYNWTKTTSGDSGRFCLGKVCAPFSPTIKEPVITTGNKTITRSNGRKYPITYADVDVDIRGHEQITSYEWGTLRYKGDGGYIPNDWFSDASYDTSFKYKKFNWYWFYYYNPGSFEYTRDYPCGFSRSYMSESKTVLGQQAVYKKGTRSVQTLSVTDAKSPARYNFHTDYFALATMGKRPLTKLCILRLKKADGTSMDKMIFLEGKAPQPSIKNFTVNHSPIGDIVDYCKETTRLDWETEQTSSVKLTGPRIDSDRQSNVNYDIGNDTPTGSLVGLRPKKDGIYSIAGESYSVTSPEKTIPVYIYRTRCFEECLINEFETALPPARVAMVSEVNPNLCVDLPVIGKQCAPSGDRLLCEAAMLSAQVQSKTGAVLGPLAPPLTRVVCLAMFISKEIKKKNTNICQGTLPDEELDLVSLLSNARTGFVKGMLHGFVWGFFGGLVSGLTAGLSGFVSCTGWINQLADAFFSFIGSEVMQQLQVALNVRFFDGPNTNLIGEGIGYHIGDIIGADAGAQGGAELGAWIFAGVSKSRTEECNLKAKALIKEDKPIKPTPPGETSPPQKQPEVSAGVLSVGTIPAEGSIKGYSKENVEQVGFARVTLSEISGEEFGTTGQRILQKDDGTVSPEHWGKTLVTANGPYGDMSNSDKNKFDVILLNNFKAARNRFSSALDALTNEFKYLAGKKGWSAEVINAILSSPKFQNMANCAENSINCKK